MDADMGNMEGMNGRPYVNSRKAMENGVCVIPFIGSPKIGETNQPVYMSPKVCFVSFWPCFFCMSAEIQNKLRLC